MLDKFSRCVHARILKSNKIKSTSVYKRLVKTIHNGWALDLVSSWCGKLPRITADAISTRSRWPWLRTSWWCGRHRSRVGPKQTCQREASDKPPGAGSVRSPGCFQFGRRTLFGNLCKALHTQHHTSYFSQPYPLANQNYYLIYLKVYNDF